jgi:hypothetical protein
MVERAGRQSEWIGLVVTRRVRVSRRRALFLQQVIERNLIVPDDALAEIVDKFDDSERLISGPVLRDQELEPVGDT